MFDDITPMIEDARASVAKLREAADNASMAMTIRFYGASPEPGQGKISDAEKDAHADFAEKTLSILERIAKKQRVGF